MKPVRYGRGEALTIVTGAVAVLVQERPSLDVDELWEVAGRASSVLEVLDVLSREGISSLPAFAAVIASEDAYSAIVRGDFAIEVFGAGEPQCWDGRGITTWAEHSVPREGLRGIRVSAGSRTETLGAGTLPLSGGIVHASELWIGEATAPVAEPERIEEDAVEVPAPAVEPEPEPEPTPEPVAKVPAPPPLPVEPEVESEESALLDDGATIVDASDMEFDAMFGATVVGRRPEDAAVRLDDEDDDEEEEIEEPPSGEAPSAASLPLPPPVIAAESDEVSDHTVTRAELRRSRAASRAPAAAPAVARLRLSNGKEFVVDGPTLIGRAPQARNVPSAQLPQLVIVDDPYVSSTHLEVDRSAEGLLVTDRSSNGTLVTSPGLPGTQLPKGKQTHVPSGATLQISDDVFIQVMIG